jgi:hypothetical protein
VGGALVVVVFPPLFELPVTRTSSSSTRARWREGFRFVITVI